MTQEQPTDVTPAADPAPTAPVEPATPQGVVLDDDEVTAKVDLYTKGAYVVIVTNPKAGFLSDKVPNATSIKDYIPSLIKEWNFITKTGEPQPITLETVNKLCIQDQFVIMKALGFDRLLSDAKKNS